MMSWRLCSSAGFALPDDLLEEERGWLLEKVAGVENAMGRNLWSFSGQPNAGLASRTLRH
jgi:hypothetical protein